MKRTIISLDPEDKAWLDSEARSEKVSMAEIVRRAIRSYRRRLKGERSPDFQDLLGRTRGIWRAGDGLEYQRRLRSEWDER